MDTKLTYMAYLPKSSLPIGIILSRLIKMRVNTSGPSKLHNQDVVNFKENITTADSDADVDDDQSYFQKAKEKVLRRHCRIRQRRKMQWASGLREECVVNLHTVKFVPIGRK
jgi:hypothetical protein